VHSVNMNVNEVISTVAANSRHADREQDTGPPQRSRQHGTVVNDSFPSAMSSRQPSREAAPSAAVAALRDAIGAKSTGLE